MTHADGLVAMSASSKVGCDLFGTKLSIELIEGNANFY
jgi:hypothetical protein